MITFQHGEVEESNATVILAEENVKAFKERDADTGDLTITFDVELEPSHGDLVHLVLHDEKDATYKGTISNVDGVMTFVR